MILLITIENDASAVKEIDYSATAPQGVSISVDFGWKYGADALIVSREWVDFYSNYFSELDKQEAE